MQAVAVQTVHTELTPTRDKFQERGPVYRCGKATPEVRRS